MKKFELPITEEMKEAGEKMNAQVREWRNDATRRNEVAISELVHAACERWPDLNFKVCGELNSAGLNFKYWVEKTNDY